MSPRNSIRGENYEGCKGFGEEEPVQLHSDADGWAGRGAADPPNLSMGS